jgi:HD superfamily phosphohydrolase YqeK
VGAFCARAADALLAGGTFARRGFARAAGKTHDLLKFVDFHPTAAPAGWEESPEERAAWEEWKKRYPQPTHEEAAGAFLRDRGFPELARVVEAHSVHVAPSERRTTEEHLVYYADKRFVGDKPVTVAERYRDFGDRYGGGKRSEKSFAWERDTLDTEKLLFPDGPPF